MEKPGYYSFLPAHVRYDEDLSAREIIMYSEITALSNAQGFCHAGNNYFAELYNVSTVTVSRWIKNLERKGYISVKYQYNGSVVKNRYIVIDHAVNKNVNGTVNKNVNGAVNKNVKDNITRDINTTRDKQRDEKFKTFDLYQKHFGILNGITTDKLNNWIDDFNKGNQGDEIVSKAIEIAVSKNAKSFKYVEIILKNWSKDNVQTLEQAKKQTEPKQSKTKQQQKTEEKNSFWENKLKGVSGNEW
ncbi:DnaD domain protein [Staphylococcus haemolyticus]|uniref:DnaD domain protein n=1 Tax=Staphylococcus haemolyticus TaxID=1283 RepID=UPI0010BEC1FE|nr:DnaD domain protein [Staphylococcus haemolyticus]TXD08258.1 DnaD domain protein [Staphylococcus haemolyticus]